ncbi:MAG: folate-binding protein YgfZ [Rhodobacteraceae bacterium PARR1]|nr:MAG: folate-binding protein YgfZ [Rhodobacteraceae bacterium PARR1]
MMGETAADRVVWAVAGSEALPFLQGLVSNDVLRLEKGPGLVWAALLTPQGKYLADFLIGRLPDGGLVIDIKDDFAAATLKRLMMYRLRADVQITPTALAVQRGVSVMPEYALADPRHPALGWRLYGASGGAPAIDWDAIRVAHVIPESGIELTPETYLLEAGFERLQGVDFRKGCYVGQEVTARMKHKTELRKGLVRVVVDGAAPVGTEIVTEDGKPAGTLFTQSGGRAIAHLRLDRAEGLMRADGAVVTLDQAGA